MKWCLHVCKCVKGGFTVRGLFKEKPHDGAEQSVCFIHWFQITARKTPGEIQLSFATCAAMMMNMRRLQGFLSALRQIFPTWMRERGTEQSEEAILSKTHIYLKLPDVMLSSICMENLHFTVFCLNCADLAHVVWNMSNVELEGLFLILEEVVYVHWCI